MKLSDYKIKFTCSFQPHEMKSSYTTESIMYFYYDLKFKYKKFKMKFSSGDCGVKLLGFIEELKLLINDKYQKLEYEHGTKVSYLCTDSHIDEATCDSSYKATKIDYEDKTFYTLIFKNPNEQSLCLDFLEESEVLEFISYCDSQINKMLKQTALTDDIILTIGRDEFEWDLYNKMCTDLFDRQLTKEEVISNYYKNKEKRGL